MSKKTTSSLAAELRLFHHDEAAKRLLELEAELRDVRSSLDQAISVAVFASNDAERELRVAGLL